MYQFNPIEASKNIKNSFIDYITTSFNIADKDYAAKFRKELEKEGYIAKGPFLDVSGSYETTASLDQLVDRGDASPLFRQLEPIDEEDRELKIERPLYSHQERALLKANAGNNLVVTTGTGSGKTECFLIPVIDALLREEAHGTLDSGVRAIIIYPMNALANDQMKRLRTLLAYHPGITFGLYNGNTKQDALEALEQYHRMHKDDDNNPLEPLENELISRDAMRENPPHILITNYSMLEYMLLRPDDDKVFSGAKLRYIILDEAHVYRGTTGMETAMLMRRLRARINTRDTVQYILTSATLGGRDSDDKIVNFAHNLCGVPFKTENIIRSKDALPPMKEELDFPVEIFEALADDSRHTGEVLREYGVKDYAPNGDDAEKLYELLLHARIFRKFIEATRSPLSVQELRAQFQPITEEQFIGFISVCTKAEKGKTSLIKARYHFFVRALEGAYVTLNQPRKVFLHRRAKEFINDKERTVFEAAICTDCGRLALVGHVDNQGYLHQVARKTDMDPKTCDYYMIDDGSLGYDGSLDDEDDESNENDENSAPTGENDFVVCPMCGITASQGDLSMNKPCDCGVEYVRIKKVPRNSSGRAKCASCGSGRLRAFYLGGHAATAVLGTELYEQLPDEEVKEKAQPREKADSEDEFGFFADMCQPKAIIAPKTKQFLCFSDSRSEAASFANSMEKQYEEFLRRRAIIQVVQQLRQEGRTSLSVPAFVDRMCTLFSANRTFDIWKPDRVTGKDKLDEINNKNAWIAILNEMFNARRGTSLPSLGMLAFDYDPPSANGLLSYEDKLQRMAQGMGMPLEELRAVMNLLVMDAVYGGAIDTGGKPLDDASREYIFYTSTPKRLVLRKTDATSEKKKKKNKSRVGWAGHTRPTGTYFDNRQIKQLVHSLDWTEKKADIFLEKLWKAILAPDGEEYVFNAGDFRIRIPGDPGLHFYRCQTCGRITSYNVQGRCAYSSCNGQLVEIDPERENKDNHYVRLYRSPHMEPLQIKEHTAQLSRDRQSAYQQAFVKEKINALSCSTTFEMGVDVGTLETVYMRNVPPSPANYVQRAGRAGRALHTAAFVLTYAKLSSHDLTFYRHPQEIITGRIQAPVFELENEKVINRHIYAVALSMFFAIHPEIYADNNQSPLLNEGGYETLKEYFLTQPPELKDILRRSIPKSLHQRLGINDFSWTKGLIGEDGVDGVDGVLDIAVREFHEEVDSLKKAMTTYSKGGELGKAASVQQTLKRFRCGPNDGQRPKQLIDFLVRSNVLPKYGFPVDTVELQVNTREEDKEKSGLQLVRDLQMAIAEYAPGAEVIADGNMYVSRYIRKLPGKDNSSAWEKGFYCECPFCHEPNFTTAQLTKAKGADCISCKKHIPGRRWGRTLEPRRGFWAESHCRPAPIRRPVRDYKTDDYYVGDVQRKQLEKRRFVVNGHEVELESTANDTMAVVGLTQYNVCPVCGYATAGEIPMDHDDARGYPCRNKDGKCEGYLLSHHFKTFVAKITFFTAEALDQDTMLSVMYALLEGLSQELGIERTDLKGCLHQTLWSGGIKRIYSVILYDAVPGGAGHVRRLVTKDADVFHRVLKKALSVVENCECDTSCYQCLRNYYNTKVHDRLDRKKAANFLRGWMGDYQPVQSEEKTNSGEDDGVKIDFKPDDYLDAQGYRKWQNYGSTSDEYEELKTWDSQEISMHCLAFPTLFTGEKTIEPDLVWPEKKLAVFSDLADTQELSEQGWTVYKIGDDPALIAKILKE